MFAKLPIRNVQTFTRFSIAICQTPSKCFSIYFKGPAEDQDQEIDMEEVKQMKQEREERKSQIAEEDAENEDAEEEEGISWGMGNFFQLLY